MTDGRTDEQMYTWPLAIMHSNTVRCALKMPVTLTHQQIMKYVKNNNTTAVITTCRPTLTARSRLETTNVSSWLVRPVSRSQEVRISISSQSRALTSRAHPCMTSAKVTQSNPLSRLDSDLNGDHTEQSPFKIMGPSE